jgi:uncharacterized damage-inducible protein DinB
VTEENTAAPEPWLRGTFTEVPAVARGVLHALELAREDLHKWCGLLTAVQIHATPSGLPSAAFQLRHIAGSVDRLLTYAEARSLTEAQLQALKAETDTGGNAHELLNELDCALSQAAERIRALAAKDYAEPRFVGQKRLPSTLGGLLVHIADHTQRHVGQAITTSKLVSAAGNF